MKTVTALTFGMVIAILMMPGIVHAQDIITIRGTIQTADCQANTLTLKTADGASHVIATASSTAVFVNAAVTGPCSLPQYGASDATVWITAAGDQLVAGRVDIFVAPTPHVPEPAPGFGSGPYDGPYYGPYDGPYFYPFFGIGIDVDRRFHNRDFGRDRDVHRDRDSQGDGDPHRGTAGRNDHGGSMTGGSHGVGMGGGSHSGSRSRGGGRR
jgi:uncharacterized membrane protein YgcG